MKERGTHRTGLSRRSRLEYLINKKNIYHISKPISINKSVKEVMIEKKLKDDFIKSRSISLGEIELDINNAINEEIKKNKKSIKVKDKNNVKYIYANKHRKIKFGLYDKDTKGKYANKIKSLNEGKEGLVMSKEKYFYHKHKSIKSNSKPEVVSVSTSFNPRTVTDWEIAEMMMQYNRTFDKNLKLFIDEALVIIKEEREKMRLENIKKLEEINALKIEEKKSKKFSIKKSFKNIKETIIDQSRLLVKKVSIKTPKLDNSSPASLFETQIPHVEEKSLIPRVITERGEMDGDETLIVKPNLKISDQVKVLKEDSNDSSFSSGYIS